MAVRGTAIYDSTGAVAVTVLDAADMAGTEGLPVMGRTMPGMAAGFLRLDSFGTLKAGDSFLRFDDPLEVNMTTTTGALWVQSVTTMAAAVAAGVKTYNSASTVTTTTGVMDVSLQRFSRRSGAYNIYRARKMAKWGTVAGAGSNGVIDFGFGAPASQTALAVTDGVFFRCTASGGLCVVYSIGTGETTLETLGTFSAGVITSDGSVTGFVEGASVRVDSYYWWQIALGEDHAWVQIGDPETGTPIYQRLFFIARTLVGLGGQGSHIPIFARVFNSGAAATACQLLVNSVGVEQADKDLGQSMADMLAGLQRGSNVIPTTQLQAANYANSAAPAAATLSNTAAGYTTPGGQFIFTMVAGAETDYALFAYTVPTGYRFRCSRIKIDTASVGAASPATATLIQWAVSHNAATINLSTGTQFRETIGLQGIGAAALAGTMLAPSLEHVCNKVTESGRLLIVIVKIINGAVTASHSLRGAVTIEGQNE